jgi:phosphotransferase system HPr (HPr) family protein
VCF